MSECDLQVNTFYFIRKKKMASNEKMTQRSVNKTSSAEGNVRRHITGKGGHTTSEHSYQYGICQ